MDDLTVVELEGVNGEWFTLAGPDAGAEGFELDTDVKGLFDPPVKVVYEEPGNYPGARYLNHRVLRRDITFAVIILDDQRGPGEKSWLSRDSEWRKAWSFDRDCKLHITTPDSGTRYLKLRLGESPDISWMTDPRLESATLNVAIMTCIAGDPFWYEDDVVYPFVTTEDTTFDPNPLPFPWPHEDLPFETITFTVDPSDGKGGLNPTDQAVFLKWTVPGSTEAPSEPYVPGIPWLGAPNSPATVWTVPDYSWEEDGNENRRIRMPGLIGGLRTEEVQKIYIDGRPTGGTFKLGYGAETTGNITYNASPSVVKAALVALSGIAANDVSIQQAAAINEVQTVQITGGATGGTFTLTVNGETTGPIPFNPSDKEMLTALQALPGLAQSDVSVKSSFTIEVQKVELVGEPTGGTFTLTFNGQTTAAIPYNATASQVATALKNLSNIGTSDISVSADDDWEHSPYHVAFGDEDLLGSIPILGDLPIVGDIIRGILGLLQGLFGGLLGGALGGTSRLAGVDVVQMTGDASNLTGGSGLAVNVTTESAGSRVFDITFRGAYSGVNLPQMTGSAASLTGGSSPAVTVATETEGSRPYVVTFTDNLSGIDVPTMTIDTTLLTGGTITGRVATTTEGITAPAENVVIDTDPRVEQVSSESGSQIWSRMNGVRFRHPIPAWTPSKEFEITVSGCVPGQMGTLRIPRPWSRPWGLE